MADQAIACPSCGKKIPLTRALRAEIEASLRRQFDEELAARERELEAKRDADLARAEKEAAKKAERRLAQDLEALREQLNEQTREVDLARKQELAVRKRERELERERQDLELTLARRLDDDRRNLVEETKARFADEHRMKDAEKERQ